jgi:hypothetical protein
MKFMVVYTYDPKDRDVVVKKRMGGEPKPPGMKTLGEWSYLGGGRVFELVECDDPRAMLGASAPWAGMGKIELFPVMETDEVMKLLPK